jgi:hypothetical protein
MRSRVTSKRSPTSSRVFGLAAGEAEAVLEDHALALGEAA